MQLKRCGINGLGLAFFVLISLHCSLIYFARDPALRGVDCRIWN